MSELERAIKVVTRYLISDKSYRQSWVSNIAVCFQQQFKDNEIIDVIKISNDAANNFIEKLCNDNFTCSLEKKTFVLKMPYPVEEPKHATDFTDDDYVITREEYMDQITWYGIETNWIKRAKTGWEKIVNGYSFKPCEEPIYEKFYRELNEEN